MNNLLSIGIMLLFSFTTFSQESDNQLLKVYSEQELVQLKDNQSEYNLLVYAIDNAIEIGISDSARSSNLPSIKYEKGQSFIDLGLRITSSNQYFKIEGSNKILIVKSNWVLNNEMSRK